MSPEDQKHFDTYFDLFSSPGWKQLVEDIEKILSHAKETTHTLETIEQLYERRGNIYAYSYIINLPVMIEEAHKEASEEELDDEEDV